MSNTLDKIEAHKAEMRNTLEYWKELYELQTENANELKAENANHLQHIANVEDQRNELIGENDKLKEDADRYRIMRDPCSGIESVAFYCRGDFGQGLLSGSALDKAIDSIKTPEPKETNDT